MQWPSKKSPPLSYGNDFLLKYDIIMHSLLNKCKKTQFLNGISSQKNLFRNLVLDLIDVYQYPTPLKHSPKNAIHNYSFEIYIQVFKLCDKYYFVATIFHTFKFFNVY